MDFQKIIKNKIFIISACIFLLLSFADIVYASICRRAIIYDGSIWFLDLISEMESKGHFASEFIFDSRPRGFINLINAIPINIAYLLFHVKSKYIAGVIFSVPFFLFPFLVLIWQYFLTLRTQRVDIFISALLLQCTLIIPVSFYAICEINLATALLVLLFHYLCAKIEYKIYDIIAIILLTVISYLSTEITLYCSVIFLIATLYYAKHTKTMKEKVVKYFIGINFIFIPLFLLFLYFNFNWNYISFDRFSSEIYGLNHHYFKSFMPAIDAISMILLIIALLKKKMTDKKTFTALMIFFVILIMLLICKVGYIPCLSAITRRFFPYIIVPILLVVNLIFDIKDKKNYTVYFNLIITLLIIGCIHLSISVINTKMFKDTVEYYISETKKVNKDLIEPEKDLLKVYFNSDFKNGKSVFHCDTYVYDYINFTDTYEITKLELPLKNNPNCPNRIFFDEKYLNLGFQSVLIKTIYWDMTPIKQKIENSPEYLLKMQD